MSNFYWQYGFSYVRWVAQLYTAAQTYSTVVLIDQKHEQYAAKYKQKVYHNVVTHLIQTVLRAVLLLVSCATNCSSSKQVL